MDHLPALGGGTAADGLSGWVFPPREPDAGDGFQRCVCRAGFAPGRNTCKHAAGGYHNDHSTSRHDTNSRDQGDSSCHPTGPDRDTVLTILWAAGSIACLTWGAVSYLRLRLRIADAILIEKNIYETDQIDSPFVCGFFRPRIYLPVGLAEPDRRYVLLHEQAHIRRRDYLTKPLAYVALCFHWFNPVLWLAYHLFGRDIETATDQAVIRSFGRTDTAGYAAALLHLGHKPSFPQAVPLAFGEENPKHRIRSVLSYKKPAFWVLFVAVVACLAACVLLLGNSGGHIDGRSIDYGKVWVTGEVPDFPKDLRRELVSIYKQHRSDVTEVRDPDLQWSRPDEGYPVAIASQNRMP